jgi:cation diffusion facilitator family transporter
MTFEPQNIRPVHEIRRITLVGAVINIIMAVVKVSVGVLSQSQALVADGIHSISDLVTDLAVFIGAKYWNAPPDAAHPYGHGRLESIINIGIGILLSVVAVGIGWNSMVSIAAERSAPPGWDVFWVAIISIAVKEVLFRWTAAKGKAVKSRAVLANAWHHRSDALSSVPVAIAVLGAHLLPDMLYFDHFAAVIVTVMILKASWDIMWPSLKEIMESRAGRDLETRIIELADTFPKINEIHAVRSRRIGSAILVDFHMLVKPHMSVEKAHFLSGEFKKSIMKKEPEIADVIIHIEPFNKRM